MALPLPHATIQWTCTVQIPNQPVQFCQFLKNVKCLLRLFILFTHTHHNTTDTAHLIGGSDRIDPILLSTSHLTPHTRPLLCLFMERQSYYLHSLYNPIVITKKCPGKCPTSIQGKFNVTRQDQLPLIIKLPWRLYFQFLSHVLSFSQLHLLELQS